MRRQSSWPQAGQLRLSMNLKGSEQTAFHRTTTLVDDLNIPPFFPGFSPFLKSKKIAPSGQPLYDVPKALHRV
jgi:hypothetical protein